MEIEYLLEIVDRIRNNSLDVVFALGKVNLSLEKLILCVEKMKGSADNLDLLERKEGADND